MEQPKRILVVDDDPQRLGAMRQLFGPLDAQWDPVFVESAARGLQACAQLPFQAVLADLNMPGMGGAELLQEVMARYPATTRIVLFEPEEREAAMQCLGWAHQFLAKPLDVNYLTTMLSYTASLAAQVENDHVRELVARIGQLPAVPDLYQEISQALESEHGTTERLGAIIGKDMAMTAMILKLANSAYFGLRQPVSAPADAAAYLGADLLKALVLGHGLFGQVGSFRIPTFTIQHLWMHSLSVAATAKAIAEVEGVGARKASECFTAGLLHDLGILILASRFPDDYGQVLDITRRAGGNLDVAEQHVFGATHGEVGAYLLALWGLPAAVVEAAAYHHLPRLQSFKGFSPTLAVHAADALIAESADHELFRSAFLDGDHLEALAYLDHIAEWRAVIKT